jgi:hypothetical protein
MRVAALVALALVGSSAVVSSQERTAGVPRRPLFLVGARYEHPLREAAGVAVLIPVATDYGDGLRAYRGLLVGADVGTGGIRFAAGPAVRAKPTRGPVMFGQDVLVSISRTGRMPRRAAPESTYLGVDAGVTLVFVRFSAGIAHRVSGAAASNGTVFTWSAGMHTGW